MDSGSSRESMQSGSSGEDDQNDKSSFSAGVTSIPRLHQHPDHHLISQTHLHQPTFSTQQHLDHQYPPLTSISARDPHDTNNISSYDNNNSNPHHLSYSFLESLPQSDLDRIWSMSMNVNNPHSQPHYQQQMFYSSSTSSLAPSSSAMNPNETQTSHQTQNPNPRPIGKLSSSTTQSGKENGSPSAGRAVKKRTRASRKTPTTVLTTDTTNFRAMVQEFTGIPTPPFGPSSLFPAKKFDLFGTNNNGLDHPSLESLLVSLNKSTNNDNSYNTFAPPSISTTASHINPFSRERNQSSSHSNPCQQQSQQTMSFPQVSNSTFINLSSQAGTEHIKNHNFAFHNHSSSKPQRPLFPSKYSNSGNEAADQLGGFSNTERGEKDNISRTG